MPLFVRSPLQLELQRILTARRKDAGLSQVELADRLKRPQSYVSKLESGARRLDILGLLELAEAIGCNPADIVSELQSAGTPRQRKPRG